MPESAFRAARESRGLDKVEAIAIDDARLFDISKIDFEKLAKEFERGQHRHTAVQSLEAMIESRLAKLLAKNPLRKDLQARYDEIVADYTARRIARPLRLPSSSSFC